MGFERERRVGEDTDAIEKLFTPEFRNRLDAVIPFAHLTQEVMDRVVEKFIIQLEAQLGERSVVIELTDAARNWLSKKGYDPMFGARPLGRMIQEYVKKPLAEELLFGKLARGGTVTVDLGDDELIFAFTEPPADQEDVKEPELVE
jgi:ATP-dependent Clp protease ATP-binding subunit ClpA